MMKSPQELPDKPRLTVRHERLPLERELVGAGPPVADVVVAEIVEGTLRGRGECVPFQPYGETIEEVVDTIERLAGDVAAGLTRRQLQGLLPAGAARCGLDLALWDLDAKRHATSVWQIADLPFPHRLTTSFALALDEPAKMAAAAAEEAHRPILKLDLGRPGEIAADLERVAAVRAAVPRAKILIDAHGGWGIVDLEHHIEALAALEIAVIEQPVAPGHDGDLAELRRLVPLCADESCHDRARLESLVGLYDLVNIKLDKLGGLTEARKLMEAAQDLQFGIMVSGALSSSLGLAPAILLGQEAQWVDVDAALRLKRDRQPGLRYDGSVVYPPNVSLWG